MTLETWNPTKRWLASCAFVLTIGSLQGCIGGGGGSGGSSSAAHPTNHGQVQTFAPETASEPSLSTNSPATGGITSSAPSTSQASSGTSTNSPTTTSSQPTKTGGASTGTTSSKTGSTSNSDTSSNTSTTSTSTNSPTKTETKSGRGTLELIGINVAGAEFTGQTLPGIHGTHYFFPKDGYFDKWNIKGLRTVRFPIKWERLQPTLNGPLDPIYAGLIDTMFAQAARADMDIILDIHNYGRYRGNIIGSTQVPFSAYRNLLERVAERWHKRAALYAYDIMNEPYGAADATWPTAAQAGIDGVRKFDRIRPIYVEGMSWSSAARWPQTADRLLGLRDPVNNIVFSAHLYLDSDASGTYRDPADAVVDPMIGVRRAQPFINWLKKNGKRGQIGEMGVPNDPRYMTAMDNLLGYLQQNCIPVTYWAAGPSWGNYILSVEPNRDGTDKPQWKILEKYLGKGNCSDYGPLR